MKLIRKYDVFRELTRYADGDLSLGECIDNCQTFDISVVIKEIEAIRFALNDLKECEARGLHYAKDRLPSQTERMDKIITLLKIWGKEE